MRKLHQCLVSPARGSAQTLIAEPRGCRYSHQKTANNRISGLLLFEDQLQCHGLSIGVNTRR